MESEPFRRPQNWNILHALETLTPPSPSTSSSLDALATLASLGDIPIFLHRTHERDSVVSEVSKCPPSTNFLKPSISMATFHSTNTFGMPDISKLHVKGVEVPTRDDASDRTARGSSLFAPSLHPSHLSDRRRRSGGYWGNRFSAISDFSPFTISSYLDTCIISSDPLASPTEPEIPRASPSIPFSVCSSNSMILSPSESIVISPVENEPHDPYPPQVVFDTYQFPQVPSASNDASGKLGDAPSRSWSMVSSALFTRRSLSPSRSTTSTVHSEEFTVAPPTIRFRSPLLRNTSKPRIGSANSAQDAGQNSRSSQLQSQSQSIVRPLPISPVSPRFDGFLTPPPAYTQPTVSHSSASPGSGSGSGSGSGHSRRHPRRRHLSTHATVDLPDVLSWLRDISIEVWIDQEGFRAIRPKFQLVGYTLPHTFSSSISADVDYALTQGMALFRPARHETSTYHHSAFDTPPVLRRLTLGDSEDKDYISRQASLTIKSNGVYAVTGTEAFDDHPLAHVAALNLLQTDRDHSHNNQPQLQWRFEYLVEDRKTDAGRVIPGEKLLTPLSFSCTPGLLHPSHGKRIKLMHVLMKNIAPKLSAAKLTTELPLQGGIVDSSTGEPWSPPNTQHQILPGHRRTRSSEPTTAPWASDQCVPDDVTRGRPASVAAAVRQVTPLARRSDPNTRTHTHHLQAQVVASSPSPRLSRQILSREELAAILASFPCPTEMTSATSPIAMGLSPPSYYRHRRVQSDMQRVNELGMF